MSKRSNFKNTYPAAFFLDAEHPVELQDYLLKQGVLNQGEHVTSAEKPGEGNMNYVLRIKTSERSFILKQARPWVEKYPQLAAPVGRFSVEAKFLEEMENAAYLAGFSPSILWTDPDSFLLALEDLGDASDYTSIYQEDVFLDSADLYRAIYYLHKLHLLPLSAFPLNEEMRKLNHEHIFHFPFNSENGLDLEGIQKGLGQVALPFQKDTILKGKIQRLGEVYLSQGRCLIHGDYYPGSWLKTDRGLMVIDPEFAFHGPPEFDLAVMFAHLIMAKHNPAVLKKAWQNYHAPANFDHRLLSSFTGVEIMRRIIGIAQLPLSLTIADKINLMSKASEWIREENLLDKINI